MKYTLIFLILVCSVTYGPKAIAQSDSVRTEYRTEDESISRSEVQRFIRYITRANVEEKTLLKLGALPNATPFVQNNQSVSLGINTELAFERKLTPSFSVLLGIDNQFSMAFYRRTSADPIPGLEWRTDRTLLVTSFAKLGFRYYYRMHNRIKAGKSANNFSGVYFALQSRKPVSYYYGTHQYETTTYDVRHTILKPALREMSPPTIALQWGIQQRLGRKGYVDLNVGPELLDTRSTLYTWQLRVSAIIGLGW